MCRLREHRNLKMHVVSSLLSLAAQFMSRLASSARLETGLGHHNMTGMRESRGC